MPDAKSGSEKAALYCRSGMYGSVLSGGLAGHIYGAGGWDGGMWGGNVEDAAEHHIWDALKWPSADQMRHLGKFILSEERRYQNLIPATEMLSPNKSGDPKGYTGWSYCACSKSKDLVMVYFEKDCSSTTLSGLRANTEYKAQWFNPRNGSWIPPETFKADSKGAVRIERFPDNKKKTVTDWALKMKVIR